MGRCVGYTLAKIVVGLATLSEKDFPDTVGAWEQRALVRVPRARVRVCIVCVCCAWCVVCGARWVPVSVCLCAVCESGRGGESVRA